MVELHTHSSIYLNGDNPVGRIRFICTIIVLYHSQIGIVACWVTLHITREAESTSIWVIARYEEILSWYWIVQCDPQNTYDSVFEQVICIHNESGVFNYIDGACILKVGLFSRGACDSGRFVVQRLDSNVGIEHIGAGETSLISDDYLWVHSTVCVLCVCLCACRRGGRVTEWVKHN